MYCVAPRIGGIASIRSKTTRAGVAWAVMPGV